jgi:hypothetical protein
LRGIGGGFRRKDENDEFKEKKNFVCRTGYFSLRYVSRWTAADICGRKYGAFHGNGDTGYTGGNSGTDGDAAGNSSTDGDTAGNSSTDSYG